MRKKYCCRCYLLIAIITIALSALFGNVYGQNKNLTDKKNKKGTTVSFRNEFLKNKQNAVNSFSLNLTKINDSLKNNLSDSILFTNKNIRKFHDTLQNKGLNVLDIQRKDTLKNIYSDLCTNMFPTITLWNNFSIPVAKSFLNELKKLSEKINCKECTEKDEFTDEMNSFLEFADSIYSAKKDLLSDKYFEIIDSLKESYDIVKDSIESVYYRLEENAQKEKDLEEEKKEAEQDSINEANDSVDIPKTFSSYISLSSGYDTNPLNNCFNEGDQLRLAYLETNYLYWNSKLSFKINYAGSLVIFNRLERRNYYEHLLRARLKLGGDSLCTDIPLTITSEPNEKRSSLDFMISAGGRIDKDYYYDYDNRYLGLNAGYKYVADSSMYLRFADNLGYRDYILIYELSNITNLFSAGIMKSFDNGYRAGFFITFGLKKYTETITDTLIETLTTTTGATEEKLTTNKQPGTTSQLSGDIYFKKKWDNSFFEIDLIYRDNLKSSARYLAKYVNTTFLTEDIYNDFFAYSGFETKAVYNVKMLWDLQLNIETLLSSRKLNLPAFDLTGEEKNSKRKDLRSNIEIGLSRSFELSDGVGLDVTLTGGILRNQSNDNYNDFTSNYFSLGIGLGF